MKQVIMISFIAVVVMFAGCAAIGKVADTIAPNQKDAQGNPIPGTHTPTPITADTAGAIPYGTVVLSGFLLAINFWQKFQSDKLGKGLSSTVQAIEQAGKDPSIADAISKLKVALSNAHQVAGIQPLINDIIAKKT